MTRSGAAAWGPRGAADGSVWPASSRCWRVRTLQWVMFDYLFQTRVFCCGSNSLNWVGLCVKRYKCSFVFPPLPVWCSQSGSPSPCLLSVMCWDVLQEPWKSYSSRTTECLCILDVFCWVRKWHNNVEVEYSGNIPFCFSCQLINNTFSVFSTHCSTIPTNPLIIRTHFSELVFPGYKGYKGTPIYNILSASQKTCQNLTARGTHYNTLFLVIFPTGLGLCWLGSFPNFPHFCTIQFHSFRFL